MKWLKQLFSRRRIYSDLSDEIQEHLEEKIEELAAEGMSKEEAAAAARRQFGNVTLVQEDSRGVWRWPLLEDLIADVRYGLRVLRKNPGFTAIALLTLALGIGASTTIFSIIHAVLLTPLPYPDSSRMVVIYDRETRATGLSKLMDSYRDFEEYLDHSRSFEKVAGMTWVAANPTLTGFGPSLEVHQVQATLDFFSLLGISPELGRTFAQEDTARACTVVLSHSFWKDVLGGQRQAVGGTIRLEDQSCDVIGVMPETFVFFPAEAQVWTLITPANKLERAPRDTWLAIYARLKPGVSMPVALAELRLLHDHANERERHAAEAQPIVLPLQEELTWLAGANLRLSLIILFGAVSALLLIGCANVANLLLTRSLSRQKEIAIRSALGSGLVRLLQQLLTESLLLSVSAAALGVCLAAAAVHVFNVAQPINLPAGTVVRINIPVLLFAAGLSMVTTVLFGLVPARKASKVDLMEVLKANSQNATQGAGKRVISRVLIVAEVTLSLVLLAGAALLIESAAHFASIPLGIAPNRVVAMTLGLPPKTYADDADRAKIYDRISSGLQVLPGVQAVALSSLLPFRPVQGFDAPEVEEHQPLTAETARHDAGLIFISPQYFTALGISLLKGRTFTVSDGFQSEPVAIVNEAFVKKYFATEDPLGRHVRSFGAPPERNPWRRIVGVTADEKRGNPFQEMSWLDTPVVFLPVAQSPPNRVTLLVRSKTDPTGLAATVQRQVSQIDSDIPVSNIQSVEHLLWKEHFAYPRFRASVVGSFAAFALLLAVIGLYGVLSQVVAQRTHEIGLRMSLGASAGNVLTMIVKEGILLVSLGIALGMIMAWFLARFLGSLLYGLKSNDPVTLIAVSLLLLLATLAATSLPAVRAMRVDPMSALRYE